MAFRRAVLKIYIETANSLCLFRYPGRIRDALPHQHGAYRRPVAPHPPSRAPLRSSNSSGMNTNGDAFERGGMLDCVLATPIEPAGFLTRIRAGS